MSQVIEVEPGVYLKRRYVNSYAFKRILTPEDALRVRQTPGIRLTSSPFMPGYRDASVPGRSVVWKGLKKDEDEKTEDYLDRLGKVNSKVASGLGKAIDISKACKGVTGVIKVGDRWIPAKAICEIKEAAERRGGGE